MPPDNPLLRPEGSPVDRNGDIAYLTSIKWPADAHFGEIRCLAVAGPAAPPVQSSAAVSRTNGGRGEDIPLVATTTGIFRIGYLTRSNEALGRTAKERDGAVMGGAHTTGAERGPSYEKTGGGALICSAPTLRRFFSGAQFVHHRNCMNRVMGVAVLWGGSRDERENKPQQEYRGGVNKVKMLTTDNRRSIHSCGRE